MPVLFFAKIDEVWRLDSRLVGLAYLLYTLYWLAFKGQHHKDLSFCNGDLCINLGFHESRRKIHQKTKDFFWLPDRPFPHFPPAVICCDFSNHFSNTSRRVDEAMQGTKVLCRERQGTLAKFGSQNGCFREERMNVDDICEILIWISCLSTCCKKFIRCRWWSGEIESIWRLCNWVSMLRGIDPSLVCSQCVKVFTGTSIWFLCFISSGSYRFVRLIGYPTTGCNINSNSQAASGGAYEDAGIAALNLRLFHRLVSSTRGIFFSQGACAPWNARCGTVPFTLCGWGGGVSTSKVSTAVLTQNSSRIFGDFRCTWASVQIPELRACAKSWIFFLEDWCQCHSGPGCSEQMHLSCCYVGARIQTMLKLLLTRSLGKFYQNFHAFCQSQSKSMPVSSI